VTANSLPSVSPSQKETAAFLAFWTDKVCPRPTLLRRSEIDPADFKAILPNVWIYERLRPGEYFCRLAGEETNVRWRQSMNRKLLTDFCSPQELTIIRERFDRVLDQGLLAFGAGKIREGWMMERLYGPILGDDGERRLIMGCSTPVPWHIAQNLGDESLMIERMDYFDPFSLAPVPVNPPPDQSR